MPYLVGLTCGLAVLVGLLGCDGEPDRTWWTPEQISEVGRYPQVAVDPNGNALVMWIQSADNPDLLAESAPKSFWPERLWCRSSKRRPPARCEPR